IAQYSLFFPDAARGHTTDLSSDPACFMSCAAKISFARDIANGVPRENSRRIRKMGGCPRQQNCPKAGHPSRRLAWMRPFAIGVICAACGTSGAGAGADAGAPDGAPGQDGNVQGDGSTMPACGVVPDTLPEGDNGLAAKHPGDNGLDGEPCV